MPTATHNILASFTASISLIGDLLTCQNHGMELVVVVESFPIEEIILIIDWNFYLYNVLMVPTYQHGLTLIPEWISN